MSVVKWHDISRWIVKVPLNMASLAADGPSGGLSDTVATDVAVEVAAEPLEVAGAGVQAAETPGVAGANEPTAESNPKVGVEFEPSDDGDGFSGVDGKHPAKAGKTKAKAKVKGKAVQQRIPAPKSSCNETASIGYQWWSGKSKETIGCCGSCGSCGRYGLGGTRRCRIKCRPTDTDTGTGRCYQYGYRCVAEPVGSRWHPTIPRRYEGSSFPATVGYSGSAGGLHDASR